MRIDLEALQNKIKEIEGELEDLPKRLDDFEQGRASTAGQQEEDRLVSVMRKWRENEALKMMESLKESVSEMKQRAKDLAATYAYDLDEDGGGGNEGVKAFLSVFNQLIGEWKTAKIEQTKLEEQRKKEEQRQKKKEEAQRKLQEKLNRQMKKDELEKKKIFKSRETVRREQDFKQKLNLTMNAHVRKQTMLKAHFGDVIHDDHDHIEHDEDEEHHHGHGPHDSDDVEEMQIVDGDHDDVDQESRRTMIRKPTVPATVECTLDDMAPC